MTKTTSQSSKRRFVFMVNVPVSNRDAQRFGFLTITAAGYEVEIWNLQPLSLPHYPAEFVDRAQGYVEHVFFSYEKLIEKCDELEFCDVILCLPGLGRFERWSNRKIRMALALARGKVITISSGNYPISKASLSHRCFSAIRNPRKIWRFIAAQIAANLPEMLSPGGNLKLDAIFFAVTYDEIDTRLIDEDTRTVAIHALDFDLLLDDDNSVTAGMPIDYKTVYIESMGPLHPDFAALKLSLDISPSCWFSIINEFLVRIGKRDGMTPVIAGHPRQLGFQQMASLYSSNVVFGRIRDLVKNSQMVVSHQSTAIWLAAWFEKPIALLSMPGLPDWYEKEIRDFRQSLGCQIWDVTASPATWATPKVDTEKYREYIRSYVKLPGTPMRKFWDVVLETLDSEPVMSTSPEVVE